MKETGWEGIGGMIAVGMNVVGIKIRKYVEKKRKIDN